MFLASLAVQAKGSRLERRFSPWDTELRSPWGTALAGLSGAGVAAGVGLDSALLQPADWSLIRGFQILAESGVESRKESGNLLRLSLDSGTSWFNFGPARNKDKQAVYPQWRAGAGKAFGAGWAVGGGLGLNLLQNGLGHVERAESRITEADDIRTWGSHYRLVLGAGLSWLRGSRGLSFGFNADLAHLGGLGSEITPYASSPSRYTILPGGSGGWTLGLKGRLGRLGLGASTWIPGLGRNNFSQSYVANFDFDQPYPGWSQAGAAYDFGFLKIESDLRSINVKPLLSRKPPNMVGYYPSQPFPVRYFSGRGFCFGVSIPSPFMGEGKGEAKPGSVPSPISKEGHYYRGGLWPRLLRLGYSRDPSWYGFNTVDNPGLRTQDGWIPTLSAWSASVGLSGGRRLRWDLSVVRSVERFMHLSVTRSALFSLSGRFF